MPFRAPKSTHGPGDVFASARALRARGEGAGPDDRAKEDDADARTAAGEARPMFKDKGRIRVGADADITVFDADRIIDKATYKNRCGIRRGFNLC